jgi:hypothetical protein
MQTVTLSELAWMHDCVLINIVYDASNDAGRNVTWTMRCPDDLGYASWEGKTIELTAVDVTMLRHFAWGVTGKETINAIRPGISDAAKDSTMDARNAGVCFPDVEFTMDMHTGSFVEVICSKLQIRAYESQGGDGRSPDEDGARRGDERRG